MAVADSRDATNVDDPFVDLLAQALELKHLFRVVNRMAATQEANDALDVAVVARLGSRATHELQDVLEQLSIDSHWIKLSRKELFFLGAAILRLAPAEQVQELYRRGSKSWIPASSNTQSTPTECPTTEILSLIDKLCCGQLGSSTEEPVYEF